MHFSATMHCNTKLTSLFNMCYCRHVQMMYMYMCMYMYKWCTCTCACTCTYIHNSMILVHVAIGLLYIHLLLYIYNYYGWNGWYPIIRIIICELNIWICFFVSGYSFNVCVCTETKHVKFKCNKMAVNKCLASFYQLFGL